MHVLTVDIGNTRIKWRACDVERGWRAADPGGAFEHGTADRVAALAGLWQGLACTRAVISSVGGAAVLADVEAAIAQSQGVIAVHVLTARAEQCGVRNGYAMPQRLGADRWAMLIGARAVHPRTTLVIASLGTATTIDVLQADGLFSGGVILPGPELMRRALARDTAGLPLARGRYTGLANNTDDAIETGVAHAQAGAIERIWRLAVAGDPASLCLLTGGAVATISALLPFPVTIEDNLVLRGLLSVARAAD